MKNQSSITSKDPIIGHFFKIHIFYPHNQMHQFF